jgi:hypothetical protein
MMFAQFSGLSGMTLANSGVCANHLNGLAQLFFVADKLAVFKHGNRGRAFSRAPFRRSATVLACPPKLQRRRKASRCIVTLPNASTSNYT